MKRPAIRAGVAAAAVLLMLCSRSGIVEQTGGGSEVEVVGQIYQSGNGPAASTQVKLLPAGYNAAIMDAIVDSMIDTTDAEGRYRFSRVLPGNYNIQAVQIEQRTRMLVSGVAVEGETTVISPDTLYAPGTIRLLLPGAAVRKGYVWIPGTDIAVAVNDGGSEILLDSIPAGIIPEISYSYENDSLIITRRNVLVEPADTSVLITATEEYVGKIYLNTSSSGAGVDETVEGFPVLVRLSSDNFDFTQAKSGGEDIRFSSAAGRPLPYEIELWDRENETASIWVRVDTVYGNDSTQMLLMYWGNTAAADLSKSTAVFDTADGFQGVWHLNEYGDDPALDATVNRFDGTAYHLQDAGRTNSGIIGNGRRFDGDSGYIQMHNTAESRLNFGQDDSFTVSTWVYAETFDDMYRTVVTKGYRQYFLQLSYFPGPEALWQFSVFREEDHWNMSYTAAAGGEAQWVQLTGVRAGTTQYLFVNGAFIDSTTAVYSHENMPVDDSLLARDTSNDLSIGRFLKDPQYPTAFGPCYFKGSIDEVRISSVVRPAAWIRLCYMNQRSDDKLVQFR